MLNILSDTLFTATRTDRPKYWEDYHWEERFQTAQQRRKATRLRRDRKEEY